MNDSDSRPGAVQPKDLDLLVERVGAWYTELRAARERIQEVMSHPATRLFLSEPNSYQEYLGGQYSRKEDPNKNYPQQESQESDQLAFLQICTTQEEVCAYFANLNDGVVDLFDATPVIQALGLSTTENARGLRKNLGTRLVRTGRWVKVGIWKYRKLDWTPDFSGDGTSAESGESGSFSTPVSEPANVDETGTAAEQELVTSDGPTLVLKMTGEQQNYS